MFSISLYFYESNRKNIVYEKYVQALQETNKQHIKRIKQHIRSHKKNIQLISELAGIQKFVKAHAANNKFDSTNAQQIKDEITTSFKAFIKQEADIRQARLILNNGQEFIRVEQSDTRVMITPSNLLQSKENQYYFKIGIILPKDEIYISEISPNYEHGKIELPLWPTYRIIKNIRDEKGTVIGLIVLNIDVSQALEELNTITNPSLLSFEHFLINANGNYVAAPSSKFLFGNEVKNTSMNWFEHTVRSTPLSSSNKILTLFMGEPYLFTSQELFLSDITTENMYFLFSGLAVKKIDNEIQLQRKELFISIAVFVSFIIFIVFLYNKYIKKLEKLYQDQSNYKAIIENSSDAIFSIKETGEVLNWNQAATILFGLNESEAIGQSIFNLVASEDKPELNPVLLKDIINEHTNLRLEASPKSKQKTERILLLTLCPITPNENNKNTIALIIRDITYQKANQKKLEELNRSLESKVKLRTKELEIEKQKALDANQIKSMFVANIGHEIRTPLNGVNGLLALARDKTNQAKQDEYLALAQESAQTLNILINDLLDFSKIESGKLELNPQPFKLVPLLEQVIETCSFQIKEKNIELLLDISEIQIAWISLDEHRIKQILTNLISNAIKFTLVGEVILTVSTRISNDDKNKVICEFRVSDSGVGIAKEQQAKLFRPFIQASAGIANKFGGTGLGLSISKQLCELMEGSLTLKSQSGEGATFNVFIQSDIIQHYPDEYKQETIDLDGLAVAVFIRNDHSRRIIRNQLHSWKARAILIQDINELYLSQNNSIFNVALIDYDFFNAEVHRNLSDHKIRVVYFTNKLDSTTDLPCLAKPILPRQLLEILISPSNILSKTPKSKLKLTQVTPSLKSKEKTKSKKNETKDLAILPTTNTETDSKLEQSQIVFVVDDNEINRIVGQGILNTLSMSIKTAVNGEDLVNQLKDLQPSINLPIILMDCQMPVLDGYAATRLIREGQAGEWLNNIPIIAMTADVMSDNRKECKEAGMNDFIGKPFDPEKLKTLILRWSQKSPEKK